MASILYTSYPADVWLGNCLTTHNYKAVLTTNGHTINHLHAKRSQITNELATGNGYTQGGAAITLSVSTDTTNKKMVLTTSAVSWPSSTLSAHQMHIFRSRGGAASADELVAVVDNGSSPVVSSGTTMTWFASTWEIPLPPPV